MGGVESKRKKEAVRCLPRYPWNGEGVGVGGRMCGRCGLCSVDDIQCGD